MRKGFLSHQLCFCQSVFNKHIIYLTDDNRVDCLSPFRGEMSMTLFCEGILLAVMPDFAREESEFIRILTAQLDGDASLSVGEAVVSNIVYRKYMAENNKPCSLYTITTVNWSTARLKDNVVNLRAIL